MTRTIARSHMPRQSGNSSNKVSLPTRSASTSSGLASTTPMTSRCRPAADVVLAAIAARTTRIHVGSAVTVLSSDDPVRVFQRYSTLNAVSDGRAEVILGRGSSIESFPLFGYDLADYEDLFEEKVDLFAEPLRGEPVTWQGKTRPALVDQDVVPHLESGRFPVWIGVGGR